MSPLQEQYDEADAMGAYAAANPSRVGIHATSPRAIAAAARAFGTPLGSHRAMQMEPDEPQDCGEDYEVEEVRELLAHRPSTPNGKTFGLLQDALATIQDLQRAIGGLDFFSAGDTGLGEAQRVAEKANEVLMRAGVRHG